MKQDLDRRGLPPILAGKDYDAASVFEAANLLREARRQKRVAEIPVPEICVLDPDGDILRALRGAGRAARSPGWACYHTELYEFDHDGELFGIIGCAVGASFAVLLAEELFASGCRFLISVTSAGEIHRCGASPYFVLIDRALRDEGTSYHYLPPAEFAEADRPIAAAAMQALQGTGQTVYRGAAWTTDAPFRETAAAIERARAYADAGADGLFAAGLANISLIARLSEASPLPVNIMVAGSTPTLSALAEQGVARVSHGPRPYLIAMKALEDAARAAII